MRGLALLLTSAATVGGGAFLFGWREPWHRLAGAVLLAVFVLGAVALWRTRRGRARGAEAASGPPPSVLRPIAFGLLTGALAVGWLALGFGVLGRFAWLNEAVLDGDRAGVEARVGTLAAAGDWEAAASLLRERIGAPASPAWRSALGAALHHCLLEAARAAPSAERRLALAGEAAAAARQHGRDPRPAEETAAAARHQIELLRRMEEWRAAGRFDEIVRTARVLLEAPGAADRPRLTGWLLVGLRGRASETEDLDARVDLLREAVRVAEGLGRDTAAEDKLLAIAQAERAGRDRLAGEIERLRTACDWTGLAARIRAALVDPPPEEWGLALPAVLVEALSEAAGEAASADDAVDLLEEAAAVAKRYGLPRDRLDRRLEAARTDADAGRREEEERRAAEARRRPRALPPGAAAGVLDVDASLFPPVLALEVWVEDGAGRPVAGLAEKDFRVLLGGEPAAVVAVAPVARERSAVQVVLALDVSDSMAGEPLTEMLAGARELVAARFDEGTCFSALAFSSSVRELCPFTADPAAVGAAIGGSIRPGGGTALVDAVVAGARALSGREGRRRLVLFTDGANTAGGGDLSGAIAQCRAAEVSVHAIGLRTRSLDEATLRRLARETGGSCLVAETAAEIGAAFEGASRRVRRSFYRVVVAPAPGGDPDGALLALTVGGEGAVSVRRRTPEGRGRRP